MTHPKSTLDALPKQFVSAMRTLFDVMDDKHTGYVRLGDIERRWQQQDEGGGGNNALESLRKVTPASGLLTFERFCAGLRICLLRQHWPPPPSRVRPASVPLPERRKPGSPLPAPPNQPRVTPLLRPHHNTATVRPNNVQQRAISMPQLQTHIKTYPQQPPPPWGRSPPSPRVPMDKNKVAMALEKWRLMKTYHLPSPAKQENRENLRPTRCSASYPNLVDDPTSSSDRDAFKLVDNGGNLRSLERGPAAKKAIRRREPRRHTVSNGIDYNMIKRLKLLEQEKDFLIQGLDVVERTRNWYLQQIANVNDKLERVSKWDIPHSEYSMDAQQERLNFQMTRIAEVNQHLNALMESSEKGFPIHMNLAVHQRNIYGEQKMAAQTIQRLKEQNRALTEEIGKKSEIITELEAHKSALIRELFHARPHTKKDSNDTTLW